MTASRMRGGTLRGSIAAFSAGMAAVGTKELRGRMRGRRAFVVLTLYLLLLSLFAWGIYQFQQQGLRQSFDPFGSGVPPSAAVGQALFSGLLVLETLLVLVLAPAMTSGAISMEREKQTLDLLVTTPLGTLALVLGKLFSALTYVFLLIAASIPLASIVFTFGGVGPEDLVRGYLLLFALAFGTGAIALFYSALVRRTQPATVLSYLTVLAVTVGASVVYVFWFAMASETQPRTGFFDERRDDRPPEAVLWLNPFVADADLICGTSFGGFDATCVAVGVITGDSSVASPVQQDVGFACDNGNAPCPRPIGRGDAPGAVIGAPAPQDPAFEVPRDRFWPQSAAAFVGLGAILTLLSSQLVSPTRRLRLRRGRRRDLEPVGAAATERAPGPSAAETVTP
jgi:ABC-type transport system involved in multi-copper enzyme maturation permease subunit